METKYDTLKSRIETNLESGEKEGYKLKYLDNLPQMLKELPSETERKQLLKETVLTAYWGREKAMEFKDKDVYKIVLMAKKIHNIAEKGLEEDYFEKPTLYQRCMFWINSHLIPLSLRRGKLFDDMELDLIIKQMREDRIRHEKETGKPYKLPLA